MRVIFAGGGTGGHLFPGVSLAQELRIRDPRSEILFLCTERDGAYAGLEEQGFGVAELPGTSRGSLPRRLALLVPAAARAMRLVWRFAPDVVVGLGGYGSVAPVACASLRRVPCVLLEQNVVPGRSTRLLSRLAMEVECQWGESVPYFRRRDKVRVTGNPIRSTICRRAREAAAAELGLDPSVRTLLVVGGSQGARPLNERMVEAMPLFGSRREAIQFVHLAGRADCERVRAAYAEHGLRAAVMGFLEDMALAYSACDLALSRAGGTSIAEFAALGIPAILVPLPHAADNHQFLNARVLENGGAAVLIEQKELSPNRLVDEVARLLGDPARLAHMARQSSRFGVRRAASVVADRIEALADGRHRAGRQARELS